ncbi:MAG: hypothetical protein JW800_03805 [Candidatus Omnitrophica bacterium]|nr:hypothetical protein [Candidatus Omnitrophota bacterium]
MRSFYRQIGIILYLCVPLAAIADEIRDIKGPAYFPADYRWFVALMAVLLLVASFSLVKFVIERRRSRKVSRLGRRLPHEIAYEALEKLRSENLQSRGLSKEYYIRLSDIVRRYIESRFDIKAPEMTTEEFLFTLKQSEILTGAHKNILKDFLTFCDIVKFARYGPTKGEVDSSYDIAKKFVDETRQSEEAVRYDARIH